MESSTVGGAKSSALNGRSRTFSNSAKGASQDANNTPNAGGGAIPSSRGCTPQRTNTILESLDLSVITASGSRDQAAALFGRLLRAAESSLAMLEANQTSQDEHIEPSTLQTFTKQASDWLQQVKSSWPYSLELPASPHVALVVLLAGASVAPQD